MLLEAASLLNTVFAPVRPSLGLLRGLFPGEALPPLDGYVDVSMLQFHPIADPTTAFTGNKACARAEKGIQDHIPFSTAVLNRPLDQK